ncbi:MAG: hypothetical protein ACYTF1_06745 [Planctomycetota bacterium]|jgi:hypothetical protein
MGTITRFCICGLAVMFLLTTTGCPVADARTNNQGGGSIITAGGKIAEGSVGDLTADEWQILTDSAPSLAGLLGIELPTDVTIPQLTDEQAAAIVTLLDQHNINTIDELRSAIDNGSITEADLPESLQQMFS